MVEDLSHGVSDARAELQAAMICCTLRRISSFRHKGAMTCEAQPISLGSQSDSLWISKHAIYMSTCHPSYSCLVSTKTPPVGPPPAAAAAGNNTRQTVFDCLSRSSSDMVRGRVMKQGLQKTCRGGARGCSCLDETADQAQIDVSPLT